MPKREKFVLCCPGCGYEEHPRIVGDETSSCPACRVLLKPMLSGKEVRLRYSKVGFRTGDFPKIIQKPHVMFPMYLYARIRRVKSIEEPRRYGTWLDMKTSSGDFDVYVTCISCGSVNKITTNRISPDGMSECFACPGCRYVHRVILSGWKDRRRDKEGSCIPDWAGYL